MRRMAVLLAAMTAACCSPEPQYGDVGVGDMIPEFVLQMSDGTSCTSDDLFLGETLLVFFSTTCPDCVRELPAVQRIYDRYPNVRVVAVARGQGAGTVRTYWTSNGYTVPWCADEGRDVYDLFAQYTIPRCYYIVDGMVRALWTDDPVMTEEDFDKMRLALFPPLPPLPPLPGRSM